MKTIKVRIKGVSPLLMHSCAGVNPTHPISMEIKKISSKRNKTEEDQLQLLDLSYRVAMYYSDEVGPYMPAENLEAVIRDGAKANKNGKKVQTSIFVEPDILPLIYTGPRTMDELIKNPNFRDVRTVKIERSRLLRCRPRFNNWGLEAIINYIPEIINEEELIQAVRNAGALVGLGDFRPRYGKFLIDII